MTENKLKNMIENHELDNLMTNSDKLEKLKNSETTDQVLEILEKYNYTETKGVFERELLEILQSIELNEEDMTKVSGGKVLNRKYLAGLMGGLTMVGAMGLNGATQATDQNKVRKTPKSSTSNKVDAENVSCIGVGAIAGGIIATIAHALYDNKQTKKPSRGENKRTKEKLEAPPHQFDDFSLTEEERQIYETTKKLGATMIEYVEQYTREHSQFPPYELDPENPGNQKILELIRDTRQLWIQMSERETGDTVPGEYKDAALANSENQQLGIKTVTLTAYALNDLYEGLPIGTTTMRNLEYLMLATIYETRHPNLILRLIGLSYNLQESTASIAESLY